MALIVERVQDHLYVIVGVNVFPAHLVRAHRRHIRVEAHPDDIQIGGVVPEENARLLRCGRAVAGCPLDEASELDHLLCRAVRRHAVEILQLWHLRYSRNVKPLALYHGGSGARRIGLRGIVGCERRRRDHQQQANQARPQGQDLTCCSPPAACHCRSQNNPRARIDECAAEALARRHVGGVKPRRARIAYVEDAKFGLPKLLRQRGAGRGE